MNQFEAARLKHLKNQERRQRQELVPVVEAPVPPLVVEPKEKTPVEYLSNDGVIRVSIRLPYGSQDFTFIAPNVLNNVMPVKLVRSNLKKMLEQGLEPVFGRVVER